MRSDNLQLPCVQLPASSYNFQLPHGCHDHHGRHGHGGHSACGEHGGQYRTAFGSWQLSQFLRCLFIAALVELILIETLCFEWSKEELFRDKTA